MTEAYSHLANGGKKVNGHTNTKISDQHDYFLYEIKLSNDQVFNEQSTFILTDLLTGMFDETLNSYMTVTGASIADQLTRSYAGKSGSTDFDSWMVGYSPSLVRSEERRVGKECRCRGWREELTKRKVCERVTGSVRERYR